MNDVENVQPVVEPIVEPIVEPVVEPVVEEKIYSYQPTDEDNRPIGGKQVIKYTTEDDLREKLREQSVLLIRKLRQETRKNRLGILDEEEIPEDAQRFNGHIEFNPRDLTDDERIDISRKLMDPTTAAEATAQLFEAGIGAPLSQVGTALKDLQQDNLALRARIEANAFKADNADYYQCKENFEAISSWIVRYGLAPVRDNFQRAYDTLKAQGALILGAPIEVPAAIPVPVESVVPVVEPVVPRIPTGLTRDNSSNVGTPVQTGSEITYTIGGITYTGFDAIRAMPSDEYGRRLKTDKNFGNLVDKIEAERRKPRM